MRHRHRARPGRRGGSRERRLLRIDGTAYRGLNGLAERLAVLWLTPQMDGLFLESKSARRRFLDRLVLCFDPGHASRLNAYEQAASRAHAPAARRDAARARRAIRPSGWMALEQQIAEQGVAIAAARLDLVARLGAVLGATDGSLPAARTSPFRARSKAGSARCRRSPPRTGCGPAWRPAGPLMPRPDVPILDLIRSDLLVSFGSASGRGMPAADCSTGEQKALLIAILLGQARLMAAERGRPPLLLLDEVAAHLDDDRRRALFDALLELGVQAWLTGTDRGLFAGLGRAGAVLRRGGRPHYQELTRYGQRSLPRRPRPRRHPAEIATPAPMPRRLRQAGQARFRRPEKHDGRRRRPKAEASEFIYDSTAITVLRGLDAVRKRPGMYIGDTDDGSGLHHMVYEVVDNSIDETLAGYCDRIEVILNGDGSVTVRDNGRGIPVDIHKEEGVSAAEVIMTQLHAGGKFNQNSYKVSGGLHGVGVSVVNALSERLDLRIWRDGKEHFMRFRHGVPEAPLAVVGESGTRRGTEINFLPSRETFTKTRVRLRHPGASPARARLPQFRRAPAADRRPRGRGQIGRAPLRGRGRGLRALSRPQQDGPQPAPHRPASGEKDGITVEVAMEWNDSYHETMLCFTNNIPQRDGGTHLAGFRGALTRQINQYLNDQRPAPRRRRSRSPATTCARG